jgi:hypothetical protein
VPILKAVPNWGCDMLEHEVHTVDGFRPMDIERLRLR